MDTFADPEFRADAAGLRIDIDEKPKTGEEIATIVAGAYRAHQLTKLVGSRRGETIEAVRDDIHG